MKGVISPRVCACCGEAKTTPHYSWNQKRGTYRPTCRDCGVWLTLFRQVFGPTRDWKKNRDNQRTYEFNKRVTQRPTNIAGLNLWNAWHQPQKDSNA